MKTPTSVEEFAQFVESGKHIFMFTANWCGDCRFIEPQLPEIEAAFPDWTFVKVDRDEYIDICEKWQIMGIPSFVIVEDGKERGRLVNKLRKTKDEIVNFIENTVG